MEIKMMKLYHLNIIIKSKFNLLFLRDIKTSPGGISKDRNKDGASF